VKSARSLLTSYLNLHCLNSAITIVGDW